MYHILHCVDSLDLPKTKQFQQKHKIYRYLSYQTYANKRREKRNINVMTF